MKKAVIYTRTAMPDIANDKAQEDICRQFANQHGHEIVLVYTDNGFPGTNAKRPAFNKTIKSRKRGEWVFSSPLLPLINF